MTTPARSALSHREEGSGDPIVFLHGLTFDSSSWGPVVARLSERFRCISIDLPGHGNSRSEARSLRDVVIEVRRVLVELGVHRPILVGHSMGAAVALYYAAVHAVAGVVDVDQSVDLRPFTERVEALLPRLQAEPFEGAFEPFRQSMGIGRLPTSAAASVRQRIDPEVTTEFLSQVCRPSREEFLGHLSAAVRAVEAPILAIFGRELTPEDRRAFCDLLPRARLECWPGRGHLVHLAEPDRFASRVADFADTPWSDQADPEPAANRALLRGFVGRCLHDGDATAVELYTKNPRVAASVTSITEGFPDLRCRVEWVIADQSLVSSWLAIDGTHLGTWRGHGPTGREISVRGSLTFEVVDGRIADFWLCGDWLRMYKQLGLPV